MGSMAVEFSASALSPSEGGERDESEDGSDSFLAIVFCVVGSGARACVGMDGISVVYGREPKGVVAVLR